MKRRCCRRSFPQYPLMRRVSDGKLQTFSSDFVRHGRAIWDGEAWVLANKPATILSARHQEKANVGVAPRPPVRRGGSHTTTTRRADINL